MITCRELAELITDHLEGKLSLADSVRFQFHLGLCRHCRAYLKQMRGMVSCLSKLDQVLVAQPPSAEVRDELLARFRNFKRAK